MKHIAKKANLAAPVGGTAIAGGAAPIAAANTEKPTVVLVHGAFVDGSVWSKVIPHLEAKGLKVVAVQNPLTSLADDVAATRRVLDMQTGPVVLVGNSWGGVVITEAGQHERVKSLVYIAAFAPAEGQSIVSTSEGYPTPSGFSHLIADKEGFMTLSLEGVQKHLAQFVPAAETKMMAVIQVPVRGLNFEEKVTVAAWKTKPSWYFVSEQDHMIDPTLQKDMAKNISATTVSLSADHSPHLSRPEDVANLILAAAAATTK